MPGTDTTSDNLVLEGEKKSFMGRGLFAWYEEKYEKLEWLRATDEDIAQ
ncbi:hypothetical protein [Lentibacillus sp. Marseille-P4043]|nr:hypothetical protein [Lentibacillus sp. Marseille-P4043]